MEYLDILDENGNKTGEIKPREEAHRNGYWHKVAFIFVVNSKGEIILQKRSKEKSTNPNMWTASASGHLSAGDTDIEGAIRELEEEIGIIAKENELDFLFSVKEEYEIATATRKLNIKHISNVYLLERDIELEDLILQKEEVSEVRKIYYKDFERMLITEKDNIVKHDEIYSGLLKILKEKFD